MTKEMIPPAVDPNEFRRIESARKFWVENIDASDYDHLMYDMKFEVGEQYIKAMSIPPEEKTKLIRSRAFWVWFGQIWYLNDKGIFKARRSSMDIGTYKEVQLIMMKSYKVNRAAMQAALEG